MSPIATNDDLPSHSNSQTHGLRAQLQSLLPKHALFYARIEVHQISSVPLVHGEFAVRWKFKHAQNRMAVRKIVKSRVQGKSAEHEEQSTPIPSVVVSDAAEHSASSLSTFPVSRASSSTPTSTSTESAGVDLTQFLRADLSAHSSVTSPSPSPVSSNPKPTDHPTIPSDINSYSPSRGITPYNKLTEHAVTWNQTLHTILKIPIDRETTMLEPSPFKLVVTQRVVHGDPDAPKQPRLGAVYLDLSEYAGVGSGVERRYLLAECRMNVVIKLTTHLIPLTPDINYTAPSLPKAEILNGVMDLLDTDVDIFHTTPKGLDLWGPFHELEMEREGEELARVADKNPREERSGRVDLAPGNPNPNSSPNSKGKRTRVNDKGKEKEKERSRSRVRAHAHGWAKKLGFGFDAEAEFTDSEDGSDYDEEDDDYYQDDQGEDDEELYYSSPEEDEGDLDEDTQRQYESTPGPGSGASSIAQTKRSKTIASKSSQSSKASSSNGHGAASIWKQTLLKPLHHSPHHSPPTSIHSMPTSPHHPAFHHQPYTSPSHNLPSSDLPKKSLSDNDIAHVSSPDPATIPITKLPLAYGPKTTELLIEALFNPVKVAVLSPNGKTRTLSPESLSPFTSPSIGLGLGLELDLGEPGCSGLEEELGATRIDRDKTIKSPRKEHPPALPAAYTTATTSPRPSLDQDRAERATVCSKSSTKSRSSAASSKSVSVSTKSMGSGSGSGSGSGEGSGEHGEHGEDYDKEKKARWWWGRRKHTDASATGVISASVPNSRPSSASGHGHVHGQSSVDDTAVLPKVGAGLGHAGVVGGSIGVVRLDSATNIVSQSSLGTSHGHRTTRSTDRPLDTHTHTHSPLAAPPPPPLTQLHAHTSPLSTLALASTSLVNTTTGTTTPEVHTHTHTPPMIGRPATPRISSSSRPGTPGAAKKRRAFHEVGESISVGNMEI